MTKAAGIHLSGYQNRDFEVVDYAMTELPETGLMFRGPLPETLGDGQGYFVALGAAQTFGCFCPDPFPSIVAREIGLPALNLGYGGAGPEFFLKQTALRDYINRARFVVLQVMSARSQSNSYYSCDGLEYVTLHETGERMGAQEAFQRVAGGPAVIRSLPVHRRIRNLIGERFTRKKAQALVEEVQQRWVETSLELLDAIDRPVVLLWFSRREPAYRQRYGVTSILNEFPHIVNPEMLAPLKARVQGYVEVVTDRGSPQPLVSRFTGEPCTVTPADDRPDLGSVRWTHNRYYPSPGMHEDAAAALLSHLKANRAAYGLSEAPAA